MHGNASRDVELFERIHELVYSNQLMRESLPERSSSEHRTEKRLPFPMVQLLAPFDGLNLPQQEEFQHVQCKDISTRGFSYLTGPAMPRYRHVIVLFGRLPFRVFWAEVRHVRRNDRPDEFVVGCRIVKRL
jgi:hypothetical protein